MDVQHGSGLSPWGGAPEPRPDPAAERRERRMRYMLHSVRYGLPALILVAGFVVAFTASDREIGFEIGAMFVGVAIAVFLLNFFFRLGVSGDVERDREEAARAYFDKHGRWPDDPAG